MSFLGLRKLRKLRKFLLRYASDKGGSEATTQMFFAIILHLVSECCIFAAPKILPLGIASQKKVFFALLSARLFVSLQAESGGESLEGRLTKRMAADKADGVRRWRRRGGASGP